MQLSDGEKLILIMLSEIHEHLKIQNGIEPEFVKGAIYSGNTWGLEWRYPGIFDVSETKKAVRDQTLNFLDMWSLLESGYENLYPSEKERVNKDAGPFAGPVLFRGFDGNHEGEYLNVARFLIERLDRYSQFKKRNLNSHGSLVEAYTRMYEIFEPLRNATLGNRGLNADQIIEILKAMIHPSQRDAPT
jgi:uncharacterized protein YfbU (UPF0304 family)